MTDLLAVLLRINLALAITVVGVMAVRLPVRRLFGARVAYGLWILPLLAVAAMLVPVRVKTVTVPMSAATAAPTVVTAGPAPAVAAAPFDVQPLVVGLWITGVLASLAWLVGRQVQFARAARAGMAGPAVVGVLRPRVVTPADFAQRYTLREREIVLAHEATHVARRDPPVNAAMALLTCMNWFNPAVHLMAHWLRIDQELACDALVVAAHPKARRVYAEAMLKTQLAVRPLPLGCHWATHPLAQRVRLLSRPLPSRARRLIGGGLTATLGLVVGLGAWTARPADVIVLPEAAAVTAIERALASPPPRPPAPPSAPSKPRAPEPVAVVREPVLAEVEPPPAVLAPPPPPGLHRVRITWVAAERSWVEEGSAVRVVASGLSPDGVPLWADFTAFGSQRLYRKGAYERGDSRYSLFTSVVQQGDRLRVTVSLGKGFRPDLTAAIDLAPNQTGVVRLPTGQPIVVTATVRAETLEEIEEGQRWATKDRFARAVADLTDG